MKKILHMTPPDINNGVYRYVFNHIKYVDQNKYQFEFLTRNKEDLMRAKEYQIYHFKIQAFANTERDSEDGLRKEIIRILSKGYDAIHLHTSVWRGFLIEQIAMEMKIPRVIVHSHSTGIDFTEKQDRDRILKIHEELKKEFDSRYATDVCACSRLAGKWLFGPQISEKEIKLLPNAIEVEKYHFRSEIRKSLREKLGIENKVVIGNIGRYCYQKNQEFLIRAFAKACKKNNHLFLMLIGEGELKNQIEELIMELGVKNSAVCFDWQEHVENYLQAMDIFCLPSHFEGLPISAIEAQAAGLPCYIADTVSDEVKITPLVTFLPLIEERWQYVLEQGRMNDDRERFDEDIMEKGYDVKSGVALLEKLYDA